MGAKVLAALKEVENLCEARKQELIKIEAIFQQMGPAEDEYAEKANALDAHWDTLSDKVPDTSVTKDPVLLKLGHEADLAWAKLRHLWEETKKWLDTHKDNYSGMDAALKSLQSKMAKQKVLNFLKLSHVDPEPILKRGYVTNQDFQDAWNRMNHLHGVWLTSSARR